MVANRALESSRAATARAAHELASAGGPSSSSGVRTGFQKSPGRGSAPLGPRDRVVDPRSPEVAPQNGANLSVCPIFVRCVWFINFRYWIVCGVVFVCVCMLGWLGAFLNLRVLNFDFGVLMCVNCLWSDVVLNRRMSYSLGFSFFTWTIFLFVNFFENIWDLSVEIM